MLFHLPGQNFSVVSNISKKIFMFCCTGWELHGSQIVESDFFLDWEEGADRDCIWSIAVLTTMQFKFGYWLNCFVAWPASGLYKGYRADWVCSGIVRDGGDFVWAQGTLCWSQLWHLGLLSFICQQIRSAHMLSASLTSLNPITSLVSDDGLLSRPSGWFPPPWPQ